MLRALPATLLLVVLACVPALARADVRFGIRPFRGPSAARVHTAVVQACKSSGRVEVIDNARLEGAAAALHVDLDTDEGRAAVARELRITAFMDGRVLRRGGQLVFVLETYRGQSGEKVGEGSVRARRAAKLASLARARLASTLRRLRDAPEPEPEAVAEAEPESEAEPRPAVAETAADPESDTDPERQAEPETASASSERADAPDEAELEQGAWSAFELGASLAAITRDFSYRDAQEHLAEHEVSQAPMARLGLRWYPGAHFGEGGVAGNIGVYAHGGLMLPMSANDGGSVYETEHRELGAGLRLRVPLARSELGVHAGLGVSDVRISDSQFGGDPEVPSVAYRYARGGVDARVAVGSELQLGLGAAYLHLLAFGELGDERWFPHTRGGAVEAEVSAAYVLSPELSVQVALGMTRYFMSLNPEPGDRSVIVMRRVAGGATDQQLRLGIGAALRL